MVDGWRRVRGGGERTLARRTACRAARIHSALSHGATSQRNTGT